MTSSQKQPRTRSPERLAYWYLRLNGFLTIENFVVHPDTGRKQGTDADILAVRFRHRRENLSKPMVDDEKVASCLSFANVIIAEVKTGRCALNGPWTDPAKKNMERVIRSVGCVPEAAVAESARALHGPGVWSNDAATIRLFAVGESRQPDLSIPVDQQLIWDDVIRFVVERFKCYRKEKSSVVQWTSDGKCLKKLACGLDPDSKIRAAFGLPSATK